MRILVIHQQYPEFERNLRREACIASVSAGTSVEFAEIVAGRMIEGESLSTELFAAKAAPQVIEEALRAEAAGIDAVIPLGALDLGVDAAPQHVAIPVVGAGRTSLHLAAAVRSRIGVIVYDKPAIGFARRIARECGVDHLITSVRPVNIPTREMRERRAELEERVIAIGKAQIDEEGAEIILPLGISLVPVHLAAGDLASVLGVPVIDSLAGSMRIAELLAATGYRRAREGPMIGQGSGES